MPQGRHPTASWRSSSPVSPAAAASSARVRRHSSRVSAGRAGSRGRPALGTRDQRLRLVQQVESQLSVLAFDLGPSQADQDACPQVRRGWLGPGFPKPCAQVPRRDTARPCALAARPAARLTSAWSSPLAGPAAGVRRPAAVTAGRTA
jgi:hypothetical protein